MNKKILFSFLTLLSLLSITYINAQTGTVRGSVFEKSSGETLIGVSVVVDGTTTGTITDLDGQFSLALSPGSYTLNISYISYQTIKIDGIEVKENEVTVLNNIQMEESVLEVDEVVISAKRITTSENALMTIKKKSVEMLDGISADQIQLIGDGTAVEAAKRVTGVSIEGGKYVYIRGLGDRYSKTTLNNMDIPGLDPDRNSLQLDIFPTNLIGNIVVSKNFTADKSADYTGGLLNIETKDFPDKKIINFSLGTTYNPSMHFNNDFLSYDGGNTDFLGFDDGTRALPENASDPDFNTTPGTTTDQQVNDFTNSFNKELGANRRRSLLDLNGSFTIANQIDLNKKKEVESNNKLAYIFSLSYKSEYRYFDDVIYGEYQRDIDSSKYELIDANVLTGSFGERSFLLGGIGGLEKKKKKAKYRLTVMHLQNGTSRAGQFEIVNNGAAVGQSGFQGISDNLEYNQRSLTNILLNGSYTLKENKWQVDWRVSPTISSSTDPDIRSSAFTYLNDTIFSPGDAGLPTRIWRNLNEINIAARADATFNYNLFNEDAKLKFGASHIYKARDYEILQFDMQFSRAQELDNNDLDNVLNEDNIYPATANGIFYNSGNITPNSNAYEGNINNTGIYVSNELSFFSKLKAIIGLRAEYFALRHTGRDQTYASQVAAGNLDPEGNNLDNEKILELIDFFPSVNLIYSITENQNLRGSFSRTIARPSFKEMSFAAIIDPFTNRTFNGGLFELDVWDGNLRETDITNADLRWEYFMRNGQNFSVSAFFKHFNNPIELVRITETQTSINYQPRNVGSGIVYGLEAEFRKNLGFITDKLEGLVLNGNVTLAKSQIDMTETEFNARKEYEKEGETIDDKRPLAGQSPYVINGGISYNSYDIGLNIGVFYNVKGPTLFLVGNGLNPDVYDVPFHSLNFSVNQKLGKQKNTTLDFKVSNILNDRREQVFRSFEATDQFFSSFRPGIAFSFGISYDFVKKQKN